MQKIALLLAIISLFNCANISNKKEATTTTTASSQSTTAEFNVYWYAGNAELCRYELEQARYGEMRKGNAVLIFVTEPFSKKKQVKLDNPNTNISDAISVLKLNFTKKFDTGIYPYSVMTSSFTPIEQSEKPLKVTFTAQEWCGHVFTQLNKEKNNNYSLKAFSYFESEGDENIDLGNVLSEDGLFNQIRIAPSQLPIGKITILPTLSYLRLKHQPFKAQDATATLSQGNFNGKAVQQYQLQYSNRKVTIYFEPTFPYLIQGWEETYKDGNSDLTTRGTLKKTLISDYWSHNNTSDDELRKSFYE
jgi:hypothetical protein